MAFIQLKIECLWHGLYVQVRVLCTQLSQIFIFRTSEKLDQRTTVSRRADATRVQNEVERSVLVLVRKLERRLSNTRRSIVLTSNTTMSENKYQGKITMKFKNIR